VALGASDRALTLARLTVMGHERATGVVLFEALPAVVVAVAAGAACALALPPLVGSSPDAARGVSRASAAGGDGTSRVGNPVGPGADVERGPVAGQREGEDLVRRGDP
jgi:hypothetical protein